MPLLFSYGTLQQEDVQRSTFGRRLDGEHDQLPAYELTSVPIEDPQVAVALGRTHHANVAYNGNENICVPGTALDVTDAELALADEFEARFSYVRVTATLASSRQAWIYVHRAASARFRFDEAIPVLRRTPAVLGALLLDLPEGWILASEGPGTWSPFDVVGHLIHGERTDWLPRVEHILRHGETAPFPPFDRQAMFAASKGRSLRELLDTFAAERMESLGRLTSLNLTDADLDRRGRHPEFGVVTLGQHLATWVAHDLTHIAQVVRVMARRYSDAVGPWKAYLSILSGRR
jgi:hypothetical protein